MLWKKQKYKLLLFDLDNTLWDFDANAREAIHDIFTELRLPERIAGFEQFYDTYETHNQRLWAEYEQGRLKKEELRTLRFHLALEDFGVDDYAMAQYFGKAYVELSPRKTALFPGVRETLDYLQPKYEMAIITNGFSEVQHVKLTACGLDKYFERCFISDQIGYAKPDARIFHAAVTAFNRRKKDVLMIGDNWENDIMGARQYGIDEVFFNPAGAPHDGRTTYEIRRMEELRGIV